MVWRPGSLLCRDMLVLVESLGLKDHTLGSIRDGVSSVGVTPFSGTSVVLCTRFRVVRGRCDESSRYKEDAVVLMNKGVTQDNIVQVVHLRVVDDIPINEEKDGQVDLLTGSDSLLLEAETFDFGKVRGDLLVSLGTDIARRLAGKEDLPVFFFIDRDVIDDPQMDNLDDVILSYTFFRYVFDFGKVRGDLLVSLGTDIARRLAGKEAGRQPVALKGLPRDCKTSKS
jgi:hypothetical protein